MVYDPSGRDVAPSPRDGSVTCAPERGAPEALVTCPVMTAGCCAARLTGGGARNTAAPLSRQRANSRPAPAIAANPTMPIGTSAWDGKTSVVLLRGMTHCIPGQEGSRIPGGYRPGRVRPGTGSPPPTL